MGKNAKSYIIRAVKEEGRKMPKIYTSRTMKKTHIEVIITNAKGNRDILMNLKKDLARLRRLYQMSYAIIEVDFRE